MIRYAVKDLHALMLWMDHWNNWTRSAESYRAFDDALLTLKEKQMLAPQVECIKKHLQRLEVNDAISICDEFKLKIDYQNISLGESRGYLLSLHRVLSEAMEKRVFMYIPTDVSKYARTYQGPATQGPASMFALTAITLDVCSGAAQPFGGVVFDKFEKARFDAEQVSLCLVAGASTAAVFHMMRVVEWGVRALGADLGLRRAKDIIHVTPKGKTHKIPVVQLTPVENLTWERLHGAIRTKINARLNKLRPGPIKDKKSAHYNSILEDFHGFKDAWRNHVMHTRFECKAGEELRVLAHVDRFMKAIAAGV